MRCLARDSTQCICGYGKSSGHIDSQAQLIGDVRTAWLGITPRYAGQRRVLFGRSLGTGLAAMLAAQVQPELTVLASPCTSMVALAQAQAHYPWLPAAVLRYPLRTDEALPHVHGPVLLLHGERDTLIAPVHSQRLLRFAPAARLVSVPGAGAGAGHNDLHRFPAYTDTLAYGRAGLRVEADTVAGQPPQALQPRRWRSASNRHTPAATLTFRLSTAPCIGMRTRSSQLFFVSCRSPGPSAPSTSATGPRRSTS